MMAWGFLGMDIVGLKMVLNLALTLETLLLSSTLGSLRGLHGGNVMSDLTPTINDIFKARNSHLTRRKGIRPPLKDEFLKEAYTIVRYSNYVVSTLTNDMLFLRIPTSPP